LELDSKLTIHINYPTSSRIPATALIVFSENHQVVLGSEMHPNAELSKVDHFLLYQTSFENNNSQPVSMTLVLHAQVERKHPKSVNQSTELWSKSAWNLTLLNFEKRTKWNSNFLFDTKVSGLENGAERY